MFLGIRVDSIRFDDQLMLIAYTTAIAGVSLKTGVPLPRINTVVKLSNVYLDPTQAPSTFVRFEFSLNGHEYWMDVQLQKLDDKTWEPIGCLDNLAGEENVYRVLEDGTLILDKFASETRSDSHDSANS